MQSVSYLIFDEASGQINRKVQCSPDTIMLMEGQAIIPCPNNCDPATHYIDVDSQSITKKHTFADGELVGDTYTISLPVGTEVNWQGESYRVDDGELSVLVDQKGTFNLWLTHPFYQFEVKKIENQ